VYGYNAPAEDHGDIRMVRISDIQDNNVLWEKVPFCRIPAKDIETYLLKPNDILFARTGGTVGKSYIVNDVPYPSIYAGYLIRTQYSDLFCPQYLKYFMESPLYWEELKEGTTATAQPNCNGKKLAAMLLPIPPAMEQERIVAKLEELMHYIERYNIAQSKLDALNICINNLLKKSILQEAIQGRLIPQDPNDEPATELLERIREEKERLVSDGKLKRKDIAESTIYRGDDNKYYEKRGISLTCIDQEVTFEVPQGWKLTRLANIALIYTGNSISEQDKKAKFMGVSGRDYIGTKDVGFDCSVQYNNGVAIPKQHEGSFKIAPANSVLLCIEGGSAGRKIAIVDKDVCFGNKLCCFAPFIEISKYIFYYMQSPMFFEMFNGGKTGIIGGVSVNSIKDLLIPIPPHQEMDRILDKLEQSLASIMSR
jgi:type I restriction enzyme S subunit